MQLILVKELPILLRVKEIRVLHHQMVEADGETSETRRREQESIFP